MIGKRKSEARRWFQQSFYDLRAARRNIEGWSRGVEDG